jgi:hypothetical protein
VAEKDYGNPGVSEDEYFSEPFVPTTPMQDYLFLVGFPSVIYILGGVWVSHRLYGKI